MKSFSCQKIVFAQHPEHANEVGAHRLCTSDRRNQFVTSSLNHQTAKPNLHILIPMSLPTPGRPPVLNLDCLILHLDIAICLPINRILSHILQQIASLEVLIGMYNRLQLRSAPCTIISDFLDLLFMCILKDPRITLAVALKG